jgi:hypothetical protein
MPLTLVAATGDPFSSFGPYVPSVNDAGVVAFQFTTAEGTTGVCTADGAPTERALGDHVGAVTSHPDLTTAGAVSFYGQTPAGDDRVFLVRGGDVSAFGEEFAAVGPAGPTMNEACQVAFRADREPEMAGVYVAADGSIRTVAEAGERFVAFFGLPLIDAHGDVVFRADRPDGVQGIYREERGAIRPVVESGGVLATIAPFPSCGADGTVAFAATTLGGGHGVFTVRDGVLRPAGGGDRFASHRGALLAGDVLVRIATPADAGLGLYTGSDPVRDRVIAIGDAFLGSTVRDLAANPVSVNRHGRLAIRLALEDGRDVVVRADLG